MFEAVRLTNHPLEVFIKSINDSLTDLKVARDYLHEISETVETAEDTLLEISKLSRIMRIAIQDINIESVVDNQNPE